MWRRPIRDDLLVCDAVVAEALSSGSEEERRIISRLIDGIAVKLEAPPAPPARTAESN